MFQLTTSMKMDLSTDTYGSAVSLFTQLTLCAALQEQGICARMIHATAAAHPQHHV